jgi:hypothetical protein
MLSLREKLTARFRVGARPPDGARLSGKPRAFVSAEGKGARSRQGQAQPCGADDRLRLLGCPEAERSDFRGETMWNGYGADEALTPYPGLRVMEPVV